MKTTLTINNIEYTLQARYRGMSDKWDWKDHHEWSVCIRKPGEVRHFPYHMGCDDPVDFDDFLHCIGCDVSSVMCYLDDPLGFVSDFGFGDDHDRAGQRTYNNCLQTLDKLQSLFGDDFDDFINYVTRLDS